MGAAVAGAPPARAVLIYDDECAVCRASAFWLMRLAMARGTLEILPGRAEVRRVRFPRIADEACRAAMQLVLPDGRVVSGAAAAPELLRRLPALGWVATLLALPGLRRLAPGVHAWLARRRLRITCRLAAPGATEGRQGPTRPGVQSS